MAPQSSNAGDFGVDRSFEIAALTDHLSTPSSRFRIRQHIENLALHGMNVTDFPRRWSTESAGNIYPNSRIRSNPAKFLLAGAFEFLNVWNTFFRTLKARNYDAVWISRELVIGYPTFERMLRPPFFYDIDDAVFLNRNMRNSGVITLISSAAANFAGNKYLADYCSKYSSKVFYVPTAVNVERFLPAVDNKDRKKFVVGWSGTSSSYRYFLPLESKLAEFLEGHKDATLRICSDRFPHELPILSKYIDFEYWTSEKEAKQIQSFDIGIMPLENSEWVKGKCSYKMLLYASCGIPTITDAYGMNKDVLSLGRLGMGCENPDQWREALEFMYDQREFLSSLFPDCRRVILENFSLQVISERISTIMRTTLE